jgi:hypothetical protein
MESETMKKNRKRFVEGHFYILDKKSSERVSVFIKRMSKGG